jgi:hypothetical protein
MTSFTASMQSNNAILKWSTITEKNNFGFDVERKAVGTAAWTKIGSVSGHRTSNSPNSYSYTD